MKYYITTHALTTGIKIIEGNANYEVKGDNLVEFKEFTIDGVTKRYPLFVIKKPFWHTSAEEAINQANEMQLKELHRIYRRIAKLTNLKATNYNLPNEKEETKST